MRKAQFGTCQCCYWLSTVTGSEFRVLVLWEKPLQEWKPQCQSAPAAGSQKVKAICSRGGAGNPTLYLQYQHTRVIHAQAVQWHDIYQPLSRSRGGAGNPTLYMQYTHTHTADTCPGSTVTSHDVDLVEQWTCDTLSGARVAPLGNQKHFIG